MRTSAFSDALSFSLDLLSDPASQAKPKEIYLYITHDGRPPCAGRWVVFWRLLEADKERRDEVTGWKGMQDTGEMSSEKGGGRAGLGENEQERRTRITDERHRMPNLSVMFSLMIAAPGSPSLNLGRRICITLWICEDIVDVWLSQFEWVAL
ncbi:unnamed protein product [Amoebophrya sp. A25]|nr:unnamed protein product [Amoebophrya sp. A25]|eukprot:GSA25T00027673001.1